MRTGIDSYTYHRLLGELRPGETDPGERLANGGVAVLAEVRTLGVDAVALETCYLGPRERVDTDALLDASEHLELILSWGAPDGLAFGRSSNALPDLLGWLTVASRLACRVVRVVAGSPRLRLDAAAGDWVNVIDPLSVASRHAESLGIQLALENHGDLTATQVYELVEALQGSIGVCFDTANALRVGDDGLEAAVILGQHVQMVHLKDVEPIGPSTDPIAGPVSVPFGSGSVPLEPILEHLESIGFDGVACVELGQLAPGSDERVLAATCVRWLKHHIQQPSRS